jgi:hypothetical protein
MSSDGRTKREGREREGGGGRSGDPFPPGIAYSNRSRIGNSSRDLKTKRVVVRDLPPAAPAPLPLPPGLGESR